MLMIDSVKKCRHQIQGCYRRRRLAKAALTKVKAKDEKTKKEKDYQQRQRKRVNIELEIIEEEKEEDSSIKGDSSEADESVKINNFEKVTNEVPEKDYYNLSTQNIPVKIPLA